jgi:hypothetical protein
LNPCARNVISRYFGDQQDALDPTIDELDFVEYLKQKNQESPFVTRDEDSTYNPYDYQDPSSKTKDIGESSPFIKECPTAPAFGRKRVFKDEDSVLEDWRRERREDSTADPQQQNPAISADRRLASARNVVSQYIMSEVPLIMEFDDIDDLNYTEKTAASLNEIVIKHRHKTLPVSVLDAKNVSVEWKPFNSSEEIKKGFVMFKARDAESDTTQTVVFQFLKDDDKDVTNPDKTKSYVDMPVAISCSCESFLWYGAQWYALQGQYMYMPALRRSVVAPVPEFRISRVQRGKGLNFRVCKHILACYNVVKAWKIKTVFKSLMKYTFLSKIMNPEQWKKLLGIDFSYEAIKGFLRSPSPVPAPIRTFFKYKTNGTPDERDALKSLDEYFADRWIRKSVGQKIEVLKAYINHPEEIFYFLMREALDKKGRIDERLMREGIILMAKTIDPEYGDEIKKGNLEAIPQEKQKIQKGIEGVPKEQVEVGKGMGFVKPEDVEEHIEGEGEEEKPGPYKTPKSPRFEGKKEEKEVGRFEKPKKPKSTIQQVKSPLKPAV